MPGSGHIFIALFYLVLFIILGICIIVLVIKKFKSRDLIIFTLALTGFVGIFGFFQMRNSWSMELEHIGVYELTDFPNCNNCKMELLENNTYTIKDSKELIESGNWNLVTGDDYYVIELENGKQFGYNEYRNTGKIDK